LRRPPAALHAVAPVRAAGLARAAALRHPAMLLMLIAIRLIPALLVPIGLVPLSSVLTALSITIRLIHGSSSPEMEL
jgi:hypothetical protein